MDRIKSDRILKRNNLELDASGEFVLYWMQTTRRLHYNYALDYAVDYANRLQKPLLVLETLDCDYSWACDRFHMFCLQGMKEHINYADKTHVNYVALAERQPGENSSILYLILDEACCLISDEYPIRAVRMQNEQLSEELDISFITVDSNGLIPLQLTEKAPYNAYFFRRIMQKNFIECYTRPPRENPLDNLENRGKIKFEQEVNLKLLENRRRLLDLDKFVSSSEICHDVTAINIEGSRKGALNKLRQFTMSVMFEYGEKRNEPDERKTSELSPWLRYGKISTHEIIRAVFEQQPPGWDLGNIRDNNGSLGGFFNGDENISKFLDELITWREVGFHFAHHEPDYDMFDSLPDWARETLDKHSRDPRKPAYSLENLELAQTHDQLWNASQRQLINQGVIHGYLRMLWGKKVLEWTPDPQTALRYLISLNNKYAIDGRGPNSYSGIFWCLGRFDRAWQERPIYGKVRYMSSQRTHQKVKLEQYLSEFSN